MLKYAPATTNGVYAHTDSRQVRLKAAVVGFVAAGVASIASIAFISLTGEIGTWSAPEIHLRSAIAGALWTWLLVFRLMSQRLSRGYGAGAAIPFLTLATTLVVTVLLDEGLPAPGVLPGITLAFGLAVVYLGWLIVPIALVATWLLRNVVVGILVRSVDPQDTV